MVDGDACWMRGFFACDVGHFVQIAGAACCDCGPCAATFFKCSYLSEAGALGCTFPNLFSLFFVAVNRLFGMISSFAA